MTPRAKEIIQAVATDHGLPFHALTGPSRVKEVAYARFEAMAALRAVRRPNGEPVYSLTQIGAIFNRDHSTVFEALKVWERRKDQPRIVRSFRRLQLAKWAAMKAIRDHDTEETKASLDIIGLLMARSLAA